MKLTGRWFPQIVDRDSGNLYPIYINQKLWCKLLNLLAGDLGRPSCLVSIYCNTNFLADKLIPYVSTLGMVPPHYQGLFYHTFNTCFNARVCTLCV